MPGSRFVFAKMPNIRSSQPFDCSAEDGRGGRIAYSLELMKFIAGRNDRRQAVAAASFAQLQRWRRA
jgi:hypothetical protein